MPSAVLLYASEGGKLESWWIDAVTAKTHLCLQVLLKAICAETYFIS